VPQAIVYTVVIRGKLKARNTTNDMGKCRLQFRNPLQSMEAFYYRQKKKKTRQKWCNHPVLKRAPEALSLVKRGGEGGGKGRRRNK
jgi:hypothetical protein